MGPSLLQQFGSRFSLANGLSRLSTSLGLPDALHRLGFTDSAIPQQSKDCNKPAADDGAALSSQAAAIHGHPPSTQAAVNAATHHCEVQQRADDFVGHHDIQGASQQHSTRMSQHSSSHMVLGDKNSHVRHGRKHGLAPKVLRDRHSNENHTDTSVLEVGGVQADVVTRQPLQEVQTGSLQLKGQSVTVFGLFLPFCRLQLAT